MNKRKIIIPIFIPHKGCPFDCVFCNQKNISGQIKDMDEKQMHSIIQSFINSVPKGEVDEIAFYGGSFTGIKKEEQVKFLQIANEYIENGYVKKIRLSTRPDYINQDILNYLKHYNVSTIELGVQSLDEEVLKTASRGHGIDDVYRASKIIKENGFILGIQTMVGLPKDTSDRALYTAKKVVEISPDLVRIYPLLVIKDTYIEKMYYNREYIPLTIDDTVNLCTELVQIYRANGINVIRIGLQPTDNISKNGDVIEGPFHPALRQLVESRIALISIEKEIIKRGLNKKNDIVICTSKEKISNVIGQKKSNIMYLKGKYKYNSILVRISKDKHELYDIKY
ncbi:radical SAM protein [Herbivorax sp. ANBcel31]|uniref:elongator complex protein 3 n=1 Tax=Herbivorax sp. ANBcel31 TaxID=3069754 RepID=UPI0027AF97C2|nr:radical SAM protein [Herbivorax sp. ANBcel31]MDQ2085262.1 radical SAM protein [Herbivorax sp. ANBcel31]